MKKLLLITCLIAASVTTFAQSVKFGIKAGPNFSKLHTHYADKSEKDITSDTYTSFNAGIFADIKLGKLSLQPALNITGIGGKYLRDENSNPPGTGYSKNRFTFLQIPLNLVYHVPVGAAEIYIGAGPFFGFRIGHSGHGPSGEKEATNAFANLMRTDDDFYTNAGLDGIAGFKFKNGLLLNINYNMGLADIGHNNGDNSLKSTVIGLSLGYIFK